MGRPKRLYPHGRYRLRTPRQIENDKPYPLDLEYTWDRQAVRRTTNLFIKVTDWNQNGDNGRGEIRASYGPVDSSFFELFLESKTFKDEMEIRLEGSVRRCLSFEAMCEIYLPCPTIVEQRSISDKIGCISSKIELEDSILRAYIAQKEWLLKQMFI